MPVYRDPVLDNVHITKEPQEALRWLELPYGLFTCTGGREVLFNRVWCPIWERDDSRSKWKRADRSEYVTEKIAQTFFYSDFTEAEPVKQAKAKAALVARGLPVSDLSALVIHYVH
jgi:hypothetical protein